MWSSVWFVIFSVYKRFSNFVVWKNSPSRHWHLSMTYHCYILAIMTTLYLWTFLTEEALLLAWKSQDIWRHIPIWRKKWEDTLGVMPIRYVCSILIWLHLNEVHGDLVHIRLNMHIYSRLQIINLDCLPAPHNAYLTRICATSMHLFFVEND